MGATERVRCTLPVLQAILCGLAKGLLYVDAIATLPHITYVD